MPRKGSKKRKMLGAQGVVDGFLHWTTQYLTWLKERDFSPRTLTNSESGLGLFIEWAEMRELMRPADIRRREMEAYQRFLFHFRQPNERPLAFRTQRVRISQVSAFFRWMVKREHLVANPAAELDLPRLPKDLIKEVLTEAEAEAILEVPDTTRAVGLRDRAILELIYSTGIRRMEACELTLSALDADTGTLRVRRGKGKRERYVPVGERALFWVQTYVREVRPQFVRSIHEAPEHLFLSADGTPLNADGIGQRVRRYVKDSGVGKAGGCHLFRHTMATLMLEGGADVRLIQEMLGHESLESTQIYTRVSLRHLREVHERTHPAARLDRAPADPEGTWHLPETWRRPLGYPRKRES